MIILPNELTPEQIKTASKLITIGSRKMPYKMYAKGQYETYCPYCMTYKRVSYKELQEIRHSKTCPTCEAWFTTTTQKDNMTFVDYVAINGYGYEFVSQWEFGKPIEYISHKQIARFDNDKVYVQKGYRLGMFGRNIYFDSDKYVANDYRISHSHNYERNMYLYYGSWVYNYGSQRDKRIILENNCKYIVKSNQKKLISDNRFPIRLIPFIKIFDLKTKEEFEKYEKYFEKNVYHDREYENIQLNIFYLDYLARNNIDMGDYYTYMENMKELGLKLDKPKDFTYRANKVSQMVEAKRNKENTKKIKARYKALPKYSNGNITISPFKTPTEITNCGRALHNCIGGYVNSYANERTDIYHLDVNEKLTIAIEVCKKELKQAYADGNKSCSADLMKHIKLFCNTNGFSLGRYA